MGFCSEVVCRPDMGGCCMHTGIQFLELSPAGRKKTEHHVWANERHPVMVHAAEHLGRKGLAELIKSEKGANL